MSEQGSGGSPVHWFSDRDVDVLLYKINRRVLDRGTLFEERHREAQPRDPLEHVQVNLADFRPSAESGRRHKREWQVGNLERVGDVLVGRLGWQRSGQTLATVFDEASQTWVDREVAGDVSGVSAFALVGDGRLLGVMRHPTFAGKTIAKVFTELLNNAERQRREPTTDFDVEPVGDSQTFFAWLDDVDLVTQVEFTFKRPNPDAEESFQELFDRQEAYGADELRETIKSAGSNHGLHKGAFREDPVAAMFLAAAMAAYGYVKARGRRRGKQANFDQRANVARESLVDVGDSWDSATEAVVEAVRRRRATRRADG